MNLPAGAPGGFPVRFPLSQEFVCGPPGMPTEGGTPVSMATSLVFREGQMSYFMYITPTRVLRPVPFCLLQSRESFALCIPMGQVCILYAEVFYTIFLLVCLVLYLVFAKGELGECRRFSKVRSGQQVPAQD